MLALTVSPAESVLAWVGWFPDEDGAAIAAAVGSAATNAAGIEIQLKNLPAGALIVTAVADNWGAPDVWACHDTTEVQDAARTDAGGHGQAVAVRVGAPAGDRTMRWTRATPAGRVIGAALAFDAKAQVVPDPEAPPEPEPGPDPEPPEPEPPSPPTEGLEPPVAGATHVGLKVGPARQTITAIGFGLGSPRRPVPGIDAGEAHEGAGPRSRRQFDPAQRPEHGLRRQLQGARRRRDQAGPRHQLREEPDHQPGRQRQELRRRGHAAAVQGRQGHQRQQPQRALATGCGAATRRARSTRRTARSWTARACRRSSWSRPSSPTPTPGRTTAPAT